MTEKTETQIAKEKDAIAKMRGATSAMEGALNRIQTLENAAFKLRVLAKEIAKMVGPDCLIKTRYNNRTSKGHYANEMAVVDASALMQQIDHIFTADVETK